MTAERALIAILILTNATAWLRTFALLRHERALLRGFDRLFGFFVTHGGVK